MGKMNAKTRWTDRGALLLGSTILIIALLIFALPAITTLFAGGFIASEIFCAPRQPGTQPGTIEKMICETRYEPPPPSMQIDPESKRALENAGLRSCSVRPLKSAVSNQAVAKVNEKRFIVFCDPNNMYLSNCCYND